MQPDGSNVKKDLLTGKKTVRGAKPIAPARRKYSSIDQHDYLPEMQVNLHAPSHCTVKRVAGYLEIEVYVLICIIEGTHQASPQCH